MGKKYRNKKGKNEEWRIDDAKEIFLLRLNNSSKQQSPECDCGSKTLDRGEIKSRAVIEDLRRWCRTNHLQDMQVP